MQFDSYLLRPISANDAGILFGLIEKNRPRLEDFFAGTVARTQTPEATGGFVKEVLERLAQQIYFPYLIMDTTNNALVGFVDVKNIDWSIPKAEVGFFIDAGYEGKGIITRAVQLVTDYFFTEKGVRKFLLRTHEGNAGSRKVAEKCGFEMEGIVRRDYKTTKGEVVDLMYFGKLNG